MTEDKNGAPNERFERYQRGGGGEEKCNEKLASYK